MRGKYVNIKLNPEDREELEKFSKKAPTAYVWSTEPKSS
jgi:hypothetical protein